MAKQLIRLLILIECVIVFGVVLQAPLSVWASIYYPEYDGLIKAWKELLMGVAFVLLAGLVTIRAQWRTLFRDWLIRLSALYAGIHIILLAWQPQGVDAASAGILIDLRYLFMFVIVYATVKLYPAARRPLVVSMIAGGAIVLGFAVLQVTILPVDVLKYLGYSNATIAPYLTVDQNHEYIRINSTLRGPNPLGAYASMALACVMAYGIAQWKKLSQKRRVCLSIAMLAGLCALWASYSRSAYMAAFLGIVLVVAETIQWRTRRVVIGIVGVAVIIAGAGAYFAVYHADDVSNIILHNNPDGGAATKSDDGHISSLRDGLRLMALQPLGGGIGSTGSASLLGSQPLIIENQYLFIAHEVGWAGLTIFLALFGVVMVRLWRSRGDWLARGAFATGIGLAGIGLLLPVWVDDTVAITWWVLAAIALAQPLVKTRKAKQHDGRKRSSNHEKTA